MLFSPVVSSLNAFVSALAEAKAFGFGVPVKEQENG